MGATSSTTESPTALKRIPHDLAVALNPEELEAHNRQWTPLKNAI